MISETSRHPAALLTFFLPILLFIASRLSHNYSKAAGSIRSNARENRNYSLLLAKLRAITHKIIQATKYSQIFQPLIA